MKFIFSEIKPEDVDTVFSLVQELAIETGIVDKLKMTLDRMHQELFGKDSNWNALVIKKDSQEIVGFCFYTIININRSYHDSPMIQIDDLYIKPEHRRSGLGQKTLVKIGQIAKEKGILRIELWCLKNNSISQDFYKKYNAKKIDHIDVFRLYVKDL